ncbi:MAG TPA: ATP-binding cassette domain-containing protein [Caldilineaceae bacterium]|nr:ATP-binding cassette domain-containing protein [Caldilineaceae bacterium]
MTATAKTTNGIEAHRLEKEYRAGNGQVIHALRGLDLAVRQGEIYALLGPNGAGKTTTLGILTTLLRPTQGRAMVAGFDVVAQPAEVRRRIGVTFQEVVLDQELTGRQILDFHGRLYGQSRDERRARIQELAALVELDNELDRPAAGYSGGMKRRLELARGLMTRPDVLFLDEPTQGLDPHNRAGIWRYIRDLRKTQGLTLLLTTHSMEEAEALADRVGIVDHGALIVEGTPPELVRGLGADVVEIQGRGAVEEFIAAIQTEPFVAQVHRHLVEADAPASSPAYRLQVGVDNGDLRLAPLLNLAARAGFQAQSVAVHRPSLADAFLAYTGHALRD